MLLMQPVEIGLCSNKADGWVNGYIKDNLQDSYSIYLGFC
jgi:hypothetical protein